ncbi:MAG: TRAP transporter small permease subunit [Gammaproteobacteria bacterium]|nr:TRAP transporter small permease subunit [Gammaproteobacteria bacterium]
MRFIDVLERINVLIGRSVSWLTLVMVLVTFLIVVMRYVFGIGWIWLQESVTWMHAAVFMLAAAYTLTREEHVRVDIFYRKLSPHKRAFIDAFGSLCLLTPVALFVLYVSWDYVATSWQIKESSPEAGGLIYPFPSLLKTLIPAMAVMLLLQGLVMLIRAVSRLLGKR